jgi:sialic acid synthase SpsE/sugar phosphate isomerase/epimerase
VIVSRDIRTWACSADAPIVEALRQISEHRRGVVFCVEPDGRLAGVLTDGDFRRSVVEQPDLDLRGPVRSIANPAPLTASATSPPADVAGRLDDRIRFIPMVDDRGHLVAVASEGGSGLELDGRLIGDDQPTFVIAEIGINHNGSLDLALELVDQAAAAGADCAKFQLRDLTSLYRDASRSDEDLGTQYTLDLLDRFQLAPEDLFRAFDRCREHGLVPLCTAWDVGSLSALEHYGVPAYKVASADLTNHDLLAAVSDTGRPVLLSTGMSTESEIIEATHVLQVHGAAYALLHCNSTYPAPYKDVNLRYLERLRQIGACPVGYSGHDRGWHVAVAAVALGARIVEKHFTLDRSMEGNDHKVSLLPTEMARFVEEIRQLEEALGAPSQRRITQGEAMNRVTLAKSLIATRNLAAGAVVTAEDITMKSPGRGIQPNRRNELIGRTLTRPVTAGGFFYPSDLDDQRVEARPYRFRRPWGLPVRYHDLDALDTLAAPDFVEFHFSYQDLELDAAAYLPTPRSCGYAVHSPDLFRGDHILNLASIDDTWWHRSIDELNRVLDLTRALAPSFPSTERPVVICSLGGFTTDVPLAPTERGALYDRVIAAIDLLDRSGVDLVAQTLPPFPWYLGGQLHCNLFVDPADTAQFAQDSGLGLCLDVSHSKLACNHRRSSFAEFVEEVGPFVHHLHLVDALGTDGEGIQVAEGDIDWPILASQLDRLAPCAGFIPEIWQGHKNDGEGFWIALDRLERWF